MKKLLVVGLIIVIIAAVFLLRQPFAITKTETLIASEDTYIDRASAGSNFDTSSTFKMGESRDAASASFLKVPLFKFDFSALNIESVQSAELIIPKASCVITGQGASLGAADVFAAGSGADWSASTVTYTSYEAQLFTDTNLGSLFSNNPTCATAPERWTRDVTTRVQAWVAGTTPNRGFEIQATGTWSGAGAGDAYSFISAPQLAIVYNEPGTGPEPGVGPGVNETQNFTSSGGDGNRLALAALIFVIVFILLAVIARKRPGLAIVLGTVGGAIAAGGYLLLGGV